jgi:hypothetical protein
MILFLAVWSVGEAVERCSCYGRVMSVVVVVVGLVCSVVDLSTPDLVVNVVDRGTTSWS